MMTPVKQSIDWSRVPHDLRRDLRSDHAGEHGAVAIYKGILATARWDDVRTFASAHLQTEARHLELMERLVPTAKRSRLLPVWWLAGWLLGALPALLSRKAVFSTIMAVEQFVVGHYLQQINRLGTNQASRELRTLLMDCCTDEISHKSDAAHRLNYPNGKAAVLLSHIVALGSAFGVEVARRI